VECGLEPLVRQRLGMKTEIGFSQFTNPKKWATKIEICTHFSGPTCLVCVLVVCLLWASCVVHVWFQRIFMFEESMKEVWARMLELNAVQSLEREEAKVSIERKNLWHQGESSREKTWKWMIQKNLIERRSCLKEVLGLGVCLQTLRSVWGFVLTFVMTNFEVNNLCKHKGKTPIN
jgi:hypothetical protein